jgi:pimeloyl-ACP methyl ester carboxylesterase
MVYLKFIRVALMLIAVPACAQVKVRFASMDGLLITADLYKVDDKSPYIVLCHLAGHSRGEYTETAKRLNTYGYNCLAIDMRSGDEIFGIVNETAAAAREEHKPTGYLDAEVDIRSAVDYAYSLSEKPVILFGSSFSASLVLMIAADDSRVSKVIAFSPGEYFDGRPSVKETIRELAKPVFVSSSKDEADEVTALVSEIRSRKVHQFVPSTAGAHGSIALWAVTTGHQAYWDALVTFLESKSGL